MIIYVSPMVWRPIIVLQRFIIDWGWMSSSSSDGYYGMDEDWCRVHPVLSMDEDITETISCPPIPRPSNFGTTIGIWSYGCGAWDSTPRIKCSVVTWHAPWPCVTLCLADGSRFRQNLLAFPCFSRKTFLILAFPLSFLHFSFAFSFSNFIATLPS